jgi:hypothetical protein
MEMEAASEFPWTAPAWTTSEATVSAALMEPALPIPSSWYRARARTTTPAPRRLAPREPRMVRTQIVSFRFNLGVEHFWLGPSKPLHDASALVER